MYACLFLHPISHALLSPTTQNRTRNGQYAWQVAILSYSQDSGGLALTDQFAAGHSFRIDNIRPFESIWSILHKLSFVYALCPIDLWYALSTRRQRRARSTVPNLGDATSWNPFEGPVIANRLGLPSQTILLADLSTYRIRLTPWRILLPGVGKSVLHFCPTCATHGFHATLFQAGWIGRCPIHFDPLQDRCPGCALPVPYRYDTDTLTTPWGCGRCGTVLWEGRDVLGADSALPMQSLGGFVRTFNKMNALSSTRVTALACMQLIDTPFKSTSSDVEMALPSLLESINQPMPTRRSMYVDPELPQERVAPLQRYFGRDDCEKELACCYVTQYQRLLPPVLRADSPCHRDYYTEVLDTIPPRHVYCELIYHCLSLVLQHECLEEHRSCFAQRVDDLARDARVIKPICPWVAAFEEWEGEWESYVWRGFPYHRLHRRPGYSVRGRRGPFEWLITAIAAYEEEQEAALANWKDRRGVRTPESAWQRRSQQTQWPDLRENRSELQGLELSGRDLNDFMHLVFILRLQERYADRCARRGLLVDDEGVPIRQVPASFFALSQRKRQVRPYWHVWQRPLLPLIRRNAAVDCRGTWEVKALNHPLSHRVAETVGGSIATYGPEVGGASD